MSQRFWNKEGFPTEHCWQCTWKKFNGEKWHHHVSMQFFDSRTFLIYRSVPQRKFSALWAKNFLTENRDIPFSFKIFFRYLTFEIFWNIRWFLTKFFGTVRPKKNRRKTVIRMNVSEILSFLKLRSGSQNVFAKCETKIFDWRTRFSVLMHRKFRHPKSSGRLKALPTKFFSTVRPKKSTEIRETPYWEVFDVLKILKHRGVPQRTL